MPRTLDRRIDEITGEPGEWFVYLKPGWALNDAGTDSAQHCFGEDTRADIRKTMKRVVPCNCVDCFVDAVCTPPSEEDERAARTAEGYRMLREVRK